MDTGARCVFGINNRRQQPYGPSLAGALKVCKSLPGFRSAPGGQLVQESDVSAPVRGARLVLADLEGVRANMSASWLAQMGWDVWVLDGASARTDRYRRPYEGTDNPRGAMQGYLDWEYGLVDQLGRDGTHGFHVI